MRIGALWSPGSAWQREAPKASPGGEIALRCPTGIRGCVLLSALPDLKKKMPQCVTARSIHWWPQYVTACSMYPLFATVCHGSLYPLVATVCHGPLWDESSAGSDPMPLQVHCTQHELLMGTPFWHDRSWMG